MSDNRITKSDSNTMSLNTYDSQRKIHGMKKCESDYKNAHVKRLNNGCVKMQKHRVVKDIQNNSTKRSVSLDDVIQLLHTMRQTQVEDSQRLIRIESNQKRLFDEK